MPSKQMTVRRVLFVSLATIALALVSGARAAEPGASYDPRQAFAETDTNHDGRIDLAEFHERIVDVFYFTDTNKDGFLSPEEYARLPFSGSFTVADINGDGKLSLHEFVAVRFHQFLAADANHDCELSLEEVIAAYEERTPK
jgi:Ca2+-binding EF-hand superfamily protein